ncbi:MAG: translation initiation factor IF-2 subunit beta [Candidatus Aenigmatarchaeota archaeon]
MDIIQFDYNELLKKGMESMPKRDLNKDRFQIPEVICEIQGNKTFIKNFGDICSVLRRETLHVSKYLFKELATPGNVQENTLILQTRLSKEIIQRKIEDYTKEFVYCKVCGEPDTKFVKEGRMTFLECEACGAKWIARVI